MNIKLTLAYDGTRYYGWQKTKVGPSIEKTLQQTLNQILQHDIVLQAASRTDAGVHAVGQIVNFLTPKENLSLQKLKIGLNSLLPKDIAILDVEQVPSTFHPTLDCSSKEYHYYLCYGTAQLPQHRYFSWHYPHTVNIEKMRDTALMLTGEQNFAAFCNFKKNQQYSNYVRHVRTIHIVELENQRLRIEICGNNFLYKMVRNLVGTLTYVGSGKIDIAAIPAIVASGDRTQAGVTAPAHGLCLYRIYY